MNKNNMSSKIIKIGIDARLYGTNHGGIGRYIQELIKNLEKTDKENKYFIFLQKSNFDQYIVKNENFIKVLADFKVYSIKEQFLFPILLKKYKLDFVHFPHFNVPIFYRNEFIVTIHDLIISHYPDSRSTTLPLFIYKIKLFFYNLIIKSTAKRAKKIIAVSKFTKDDIVRLLKIDEKKVTVVYEGVDLPKENTENCQLVMNNFDVSGDFLLYVGSAYPHKNLDKLLVSFLEVIKKYPQLKLVLVGKLNYFYQKLKNKINDLKLEKNVILTNFVSDEKLVCFYQRAKLYVFPSLIEGFGLPPLEAQSHNLPVVCSNKTCLPEILGNSALFFDPEDVVDMRDKIIQGLEDEKLKQELVENGLENLKKYSWQKMAEDICKLYG